MTAKGGRDPEGLRVAGTEELLRRSLGSKDLAGVQAATGIVGESVGIRKALRWLALFAEEESTVLVTGESGTGKELVARGLHRLSPRSEGPFLPVNVSAIPGALAESELFGHEAGAFTGAARSRQGLFEQAEGGSLFLDEIGEMALPLQARLLRALEGGEVRRVGGAQPLRVNARVISATNRDLRQSVTDGRFRHDLFHRLNALTVALPPLRERRGDLPLLTNHFLARFGEGRGQAHPKITDSGMQCLMAHSWPGNVRELKFVVLRLSVLFAGAAVGRKEVEEAIAGAGSAGRGDGGDRSLSPPDGRIREDGEATKKAPEKPRPLRAVERDEIRNALEWTKGNQSRAARLLGVSRSTVARKAKEYGIT